MEYIDVSSADGLSELSDGVYFIFFVFFLALYPLAHHPEGCGLFPGVRTAT